MKFLSQTLPSVEAKKLREDYKKLTFLTSHERFRQILTYHFVEKNFRNVTCYIKTLDDKITFLFKREACECVKGTYWDDYYDCQCDIETLETTVFDVSNTFQDFIKCLVALKDCSRFLNFTTLAIWDMSELTEAGIKSVPEGDKYMEEPTILYQEPELSEDLPDDLEEMPPSLPETLPDF